MDLQTKVILRSFSANTVFADSNWGTEPALVMDGIYVSQRVVPGNRFTDISVRVMNVRSEELVINAGTSVADLQPVTVLGSIPVCETGGIPVSCRNMNGRLLKLSRRPVLSSGTKEKSKSKSKSMHRTKDNPEKKQLQMSDLAGSKRRHGD